MRILTCSDTAVLVEVDDVDQVIALSAALAASPLPGVTDVVSAARTVLLRLEPGVDPAVIATVVAGMPLNGDVARRDGETITIPVHYDGEDLADIAALTEMTPDEVVRAHTAATWTVAFCGFAPGFGYMVGDDPRFALPRRGEARTRVPQGAVALAGGFTGVYPRSSPGGWRLLGRTDTVTWDLERDPPGLLRPGTCVRFEEAS